MLASTEGELTGAVSLYVTSLLFISYVRANSGGIFPAFVTVAIVFYAYFPFIAFDPDLHNVFSGYARRLPTTQMAWLIIVISAFPFYYLFLSRKTNLTRIPLSNIAPRDVSAAYRLGVVCILVALANYLYLGFLYGDLFVLLNLFDYRSFRERGDIVVGAWVGFGIKLFAPGAALLGYCVLIRHRRFSASVLFLISVVLMIGTGTRQHILSVILTLIALSSWLSLRDRTGARSIGVLLVGAMAIVLAIAMRVARGGIEGLEGFVLLNTLYYDTFDSICFVIEYVDANGVAFLYTVYSLLVAWIPRDLWADKPLNFGRTLAYWIWGDQLDTGSSYGPLLAGESYANLGILGVIIFSWAVALLYRCAWRKVIRQRSPAAIVIGLMFVVNVIVVFRGEFAGAFIDSLFKVIMPIFLFVFMERVVPRRHIVRHIAKEPR
jgi:oligosaccharide repeat unit polymerase